jgi:hypothetical protein
MAEQGLEPIAPKFDWMSEYRCVEEMLATGRGHQVGPHVREISKKYSNSRYLHMFLGLVCRGMNAPGDALKSFETGTVFSSTESLPGLDSPLTHVYVDTQLQFEGETRPCTLRAKENYQKNLTALRTIDPGLVEEIEGAPADPSVQFIDLWGRLHLFTTQGQKVLVLSKGFENEIQPLLRECKPLAISMMVSGQEVGFVLDHQTKDFLLGRKRIVYWFETQAGRLRAQLHLRDYSAELMSRALVLFGGDGAGKRIEEVFGTFRYPPPLVILGDDKPIADQMKRILEILDPDEYRQTAEAYYQSEVFSRRLRQIAAGEILPRVLGSTCRWTTFLQYCAKDFLQAFGRIGCETFLEIEESDVENLTQKLVWKTLNDFRPDLLFSVSHARPSFIVPKELPVVSFLQDKCGPIAALKDLSPVITAQDLFVCMSREMRRYLVERSIPKDQCLVMPIPSDEQVFYPLARDLAGMERYTVDVGFVKHADTYGESAFANFIEHQIRKNTPSFLMQALEDSFTALYQTTCLTKDGRRHYCAEMEEFVFSRIGHLINPGDRFALSQLVTNYYTVVFANTWRYQFIEALEEAGIEVGLYGKGWDGNVRFRHLSRGPVDRNTELNKVYNYNKISLNIHPGTTMHQRICECGLAGGFMLDANHEEQIDYEPIRPYFEPGKEIILFETAQDLVEKCRYYLAHPEAREQIADNARRRALAERTTFAGAQKILTEWRNLLRRSN